ncbi:DUF4145 domain-containing protein [Desulfosporosinus lacus]|uniref:DUF4145 domain-containing protein n=1 Tax=Desulfosporosinus lacus DSM 15449 TaxID=1121420 RepID=A0A1M6H0Z7_9FIRM|nr:DUF4145 domain-containing protein [Desulfosporosinus lacus]SHJ15883.1 protein of unknown function [Desulfosporosinus lacus DSM 15449]
MIRISEKTFCNRCRCKTNHSVLENDGIALEYIQKHSATNICTHFIVKCDGCDTISFLREVKYINNDNEQKVIYQLHPDPLQRMDDLELPKLTNIPNTVSYILTEVYVAYIQQMYLLCSIGLRITVEAICDEKAINGKNLADKIDNLRASSIISDSQSNILQKIRMIGNRAAHEISALDQELLREGIQIINNILYSIFEIEKIKFE